MERGLVVSCQALEHEPLHSSYIMSRMAVAAKEGGAIGIRANSVSDIVEIKKVVDLPIIGIIKKNYDDRENYITPTMVEVDALVNIGVDIIAVDAGFNTDINFLKELRIKYPNQKFMADISTTDEGIRAEKLGFDYVGTTLVSYTKQSKGLDKFVVLKELIEQCTIPVIAEGNFDTPEKCRQALEMGAFCVVVGGAITRPQQITEKFVDAIKEL